MKENYIKKSAGEFRKEVPAFIETKKQCGKRMISVFFDFTSLDKIKEIPGAVKEELKQKISNEMGRVDAVSFCNSSIDPIGQLKFYMDADGITYNVIDDKKGKILYSVIKIKGIRFYAYKQNIYGYYDGLPCMSGEYDWSKSVITPIHDLYYIA